MALFFAAIVLLILLAASYSGRRAWTVLGSTAFSTVLIAAWFVLAHSQQAAPFLNLLAENTLPAGWSGPAKNLVNALERASVSGNPTRRPAAGETYALANAASVSHGIDGGRRPKLTKPTPPAREPQPLGAHGPVEWITAARASGGPMILLTGVNQSNAPLEDIRATLKPDSPEAISAPDALTLRLRIEGQAVDGTGADGVPPGMRFHLEAPTLTEDQARALGGAIVSFAYRQAGRRRTTIMYLGRTALAAGAP